MARKTTSDTGSAAAAFEPDTVYDATFKRPARLGRTLFSPLHRYRVKGRVLAELPADCIASAAPHPES